MGLFEKAGRRFEQFKNETKAAAEEEAEYECASCETLLYASADRCPECGGDDVVPIDRSNEENPGDDRESSGDGTE
jgi:rRNA maturation endonuclease Nob1